MNNSDFVVGIHPRTCLVYGDLISYAGGIEINVKDEISSLMISNDARYRSPYPYDIQISLTPRWSARTQSQLTHVITGTKQDMKTIALQLAKACCTTQTERVAFAQKLLEEKDERLA